MDVNKYKLSMYNLPQCYGNMTYDSIDISSVKAKDLEEKITRAPRAGLLVIKGTAGPVVNQLLAMERRVRGIDFIEMNNDAFGVHEFPSAEVVVVYNVGFEVSTKFSVSGMVLQKLIQYYKDRRTLVILETKLSKTDLLTKYDLSVTNFIALPEKSEEKWI